MVGQAAPSFGLKAPVDPQVEKDFKHERKFQRVKINVTGRYMLADRREFNCRTINASPGGIALEASYSGQVGERVIVYLNDLGRIEGEIVRHLPNGFAMTIEATAIKRDKLAAKLTWLANKDALGLVDSRQYERMVSDVKRTMIQLPDGRSYYCKVIDVSLSGAAIQMDVTPAVGTSVTLGRMKAKVVRHFDEGIGLQFNAVQASVELIQHGLRSPANHEENS